MTTFYFNNNKENKELFDDWYNTASILPISPPLNNKDEIQQAFSGAQDSNSNSNSNNSGNNNWYSLWSNSDPTWKTAPSRSNSISFSNSIWSFNKEEVEELEVRRHSISNIIAQNYFSPNRPVTPPNQIHQQQIDEYFSPTTNIKNMDVQYLGKGISVDEIKQGQSIYQIQFKGNYHTDYYYLDNDIIKIELNDMMIVEADRGYDLGRVVSVTQNKPPISHLKRIFRHANPAELLTFNMKTQDEQHALNICQSKIQEKNLNMEIIDAEYQWDRRKLTFYFKSNERIDFRELVRELFKLYKTRIWMCAYNEDN